MENEKYPRSASVFDRLKWNLFLHTSTQKLHKSVRRYLAFALFVVLLMAGVIAIEVRHSLQTDQRLELLEEKAFAK